jgi:hypothetical protein
VTTDEREPGWYDDPRQPGAHRYWTGEQWTMPPTLTDPPGEAQRRRTWPSAFCIIAGAVGLWLGETYKPSASNQLGLNGNSFYLNPGPDHLIVVVSIVLIGLGAVRLLLSPSQR